MSQGQGGQGGDERVRGGCEKNGAAAHPSVVTPPFAPISAPTFFFAGPSASLSFPSSSEPATAASPCATASSNLRERQSGGAVSRERLAWHAASGTGHVR